MRMKKKGFTLIELLVVIAIIGILATIASISMGNARKKARDSKRLADVNQMKTALELYYNENEKYTGACKASGETTNSKTITCTNDKYINWENVIDPSAKGADSSPLCDGSNTEVCDYGIKIPDDDSFEIYFYLETATGGVSAGPHKMTKGGIE